MTLLSKKNITSSSVCYTSLGAINSWICSQKTQHRLYISNLRMIENEDLFGGAFSHDPDEFEFDDGRDPDYVIRDAGIAIARIQPIWRRPIDLIGQRPIHEAYKKSILALADITEDQVNTFLRSYKTAPSLEYSRQDVIDYNSLNAKQQEVLGVSRTRISGETNVRGVIVQGKAGTGKTAVIKAIYRCLDSEQSALHTSKLYQVLALTGAAAVIMDGKTIHSFSRIQIQG